MSVSADGANVMLGCHEGVAVQLCNCFNLFIVIAHCIAHRHALAVSEAAERTSVAQWFDAALKDILNYFSKSTKRNARLAQIQEELGLGVLRLLKLAMTRWLSRGNVTARIYDILAALFQEFKEEAKDGGPCALALLALIVSHRFILTIALMRDVLVHLNALSKIFQQKHVRWSVVTQQAALSRKVISHAFRLDDEGNVTDKPPLSPAYLKLVEDMTTDSSRERKIKYTHKGVEAIQYDSLIHKEVIEGMREFAAHVVQNLSDRFSSNELLEAHEVWELEAMPADQSEWDSIKHKYGDAKIDQLLEFYGRYLHIEPDFCLKPCAYSKYFSVCGCVGSSLWL